MDDSKRESMHYTRHPTDRSPAIRLPNADGTGTAVAAAPTVKWLAVYLVLDRRLTFRHHVKTLAARAANTVNGITILANTVRGLSQTHLRHLYRSCVIPVIMQAQYGGPGRNNTSKSSSGSNAEHSA
jgi:hypothetical protein